MKIIHGGREVEFRNLLLGEVCVYRGEVCMPTVGVQTSDGKLYNAVKLEDGDLVRIEPKEKVCYYKDAAIMLEGS